MRDNVYESYQASVHYSNRSGVRATCPDCHVPKKWADKIVRKVQASKEVLGAILGTIGTEEKFIAHRPTLAKREWVRFHKNDSLECRNCHDQVFMNFDDQQAPGAFMHSVMMEDGAFTCIDCHKGIAHVLPALAGLDEISPDTLEPTMRPPYDHAKTTQEQY
jgi:cytochrome c-type protein NapC